MDRLARPSGSGPVTAAKKLAGGVQKNVFLIERGKHAFVLRRPSKHSNTPQLELLMRLRRDAIRELSLAGDVGRSREFMSGEARRCVLLVRGVLPSA